MPAATNARGEKLSKQTLAPEAMAQDAAKLLGDALAFLGQPRPATHAPAEILCEAVAAWNVGRIPRRLAQVVAV